jgi:hypothetical protein
MVKLAKLMSFDFFVAFVIRGETKVMNKCVMITISIPDSKSFSTWTQRPNQLELSSFINKILDTTSSIFERTSKERRP